MDEPTPGELMRAIQEIKANQATFQQRMEGLFRDQSSELARNYVRNDLYEERAKRHGERLGRVETDQSAQDQRIREAKQLAEEAKEFVAAEFAHRDDETRKLRILVWTSFGSPLLITLIGIGIELART